MRRRMRFQILCQLLFFLKKTNVIDVSLHVKYDNKILVFLSLHNWFCLAVEPTISFKKRHFGTYYRKSPHRASPHSTDFSIVRFFKNMNSSHRKVHPLYSTVFTVDKKWVLYCIFIKFTIPLIGRISHSTVFSCSGKIVLWGDFLYM